MCYPLGVRRLVDFLCEQVTCAFVALIIACYLAALSWALLWWLGFPLPGPPLARPAPVPPLG